MALTQLAYHYQNIGFLQFEADTADTKKQEGHYNRKIIKLKTKGLVEHDRILNHFLVD